MTPEMVYYACVEAVAKLRAETLAKAHAAAPHRFAHGMPTPFAALLLADWINKPAAAQEATVLLQEIART